MKAIFLIVSLFFTITVEAQDKMPYQIFTGKGKKTTYSKMVESSLKNEIVLFGEHHNSAIIHWLQLEFTKDVASKTSIILGAEMIETDNQEPLNKYLNGEYSQEKLDSMARLWPNYKTDYKPLVDFAKESKIKFIATNIPRRYASLVFKKDFQALDALSNEEKKYIAPLPILFDLNLPQYKAMLGMQGGHAGDKMPKAQAIKDATMAHFIAKNKAPKELFIHFNGTYHSDFFEGIYWYLKKIDQNFKIITIAMVEQKQLENLEKEHFNKADFIIVVDEDATKTYH